MLNQFQKQLVNKYSKYKEHYADYFSGKVIDSPISSIVEGTIFTNKVLSAVCQIPYGETRSYSDIALAIGKPKAVRAVASAIAANKLLIVIPCHRVIRSDGSMGKYRGGEKLKQQLLIFEKQNLQRK